MDGRQHDAEKAKKATPVKANSKGGPVAAEAPRAASTPDFGVPAVDWSGMGPAFGDAYPSANLASVFGMSGTPVAPAAAATAAATAASNHSGGSAPGSFSFGSSGAAAKPSKAGAKGGVKATKPSADTSGGWFAPGFLQQQSQAMAQAASVMRNATATATATDSTGSGSATAAAAPPATAPGTSTAAAPSFSASMPVFGASTSAGSAAGPFTFVPAAPAAAAAAPPVAPAPAPAAAVASGGSGFGAGLWGKLNSSGSGSGSGSGNGSGSSGGEAPGAPASAPGSGEKAAKAKPLNAQRKGGSSSSSSHGPSFAGIVPPFVPQAAQQAFGFGGVPSAAAAAASAAPASAFAGFAPAAQHGASHSSKKHARAGNDTESDEDDEDGDYDDEDEDDEDDEDEDDEEVEHGTDSDGSSTQDEEDEDDRTGHFTGAQWQTKPSGSSSSASSSGWRAPSGPAASPPPLSPLQPPSPASPGTASKRQQQQQQPPPPLRSADSFFSPGGAAASASAAAPAPAAASPPSATASSKAPPSHEALIAQARDLYSRRDFAAAHKKFSDALAQKSDDAMALSNRAACSMMLGQHEAAIFDCARAVFIDPEYSSAYMRRARALLSLGELDAARIDAVSAEGAAAMAAKTAPAVQNLRTAQGMVAAITALRRAEEQAQRNVEARLYSAAITQLDRAVEACSVDIPLSLTGACIRAKALRGLGQYAQACEVCAAALPPVWDGSCDILANRSRQTPLAVELAVTYALCTWCAEDGDKAERVLLGVLRSHPLWAAAEELQERIRTCEAAKAGGNAKYRAGQYDAAIAQYSVGLRCNLDDCPPARANLLSNRAAAHMALQQWQEGIADATAALEVNTNHVKARLRRARCYVAQKMWAKALSDFALVLESMRSGQDRAGINGRVDVPVATIEGEAAEVRAKQAAEERAKRERAERERQQQQQARGRGPWYQQAPQRQRSPSPKPPDHYSILGVTATFTEAEIKKAYRKMALETHPDKGGTEERFKAVAEAYAVLSDESARRAHDVKVAAWTRKWASSSATHTATGSVFSSTYGRSTGYTGFSGFGNTGANRGGASRGGGASAGGSSSSGGWYNAQTSHDDEEEDDEEDEEDEEDEDEYEGANAAYDRYFYGKRY